MIAITYIVNDIMQYAFIIRVNVDAKVINFVFTRQNLMSQTMFKLVPINHNNKSQKSCKSCVALQQSTFTSHSSIMAQVLCIHFGAVKCMQIKIK